MQIPVSWRFVLKGSTRNRNDMKINIKIIFYVFDLGINFGFCVSQKISLFLQ